MLNKTNHFVPPRKEIKIGASYGTTTKENLTETINYFFGKTHRIALPSRNQK